MPASNSNPNYFWNQQKPNYTSKEFAGAMDMISKGSRGVFEWLQKRRQTKNRNERFAIWKAAYEKDPRDAEMQSVKGNAEWIEVGNKRNNVLDSFYDVYLNPENNETDKDII